MKTHGRRIPGAANGARVGGFIFGAGLIGATLLGARATFDYWPALPFYAFGLYWIVRPWFIGVEIHDDRLIVHSWYRRYTIMSAEITNVTVGEYMGPNGTIGWLPFVGSVGVIEVRLKNGRSRAFPATVGRRWSVARRAAKIRSSYNIRFKWDPSDPFSFD